MTLDHDQLASPAIGDPDSPSYPARTTAFIGSVSLLGQVADKLFSFGQIIVIAAIFGAGTTSDIYFLASIVPLTIGWVVGEPSGRAAMTLLVRTSGRTRRTGLAAAGFAFTALDLLVLTAAYVGVAIVVVKTFAPAGSTALAPWLLLALVAPFMGISGYLTGLLLWLERYGWSALRFPGASGAGLLVMLVAISFTHTLWWIALSVSVGYVLSAFALLIGVGRALGWAWPFTCTRADFRNALEARKLVLAPAVGAVFGGQMIVLFERLLASTLGPGAISSISYARGVATAPTVFGQAIGASGYPALVRAEAAAAYEFLRGSFLRSFRLSLYAGITTGSLLMLFGSNFIAALFQRGHFGHDAVARTGVLLVIFGAATLVGSVTANLMQVLYGINRFRGVFILEIVIFIAYVIAAPSLRAIAGLNGLAGALAVAQGCGAVVATVIAARAIRLRIGDIWREALLPVLWRGGIVALALGIFRLIADRAHVPLALEGVFHVGGATICFAVVSVAVLLWTGLPESEALRALLRRRFGVARRATG